MMPEPTPGPDEKLSFKTPGKNIAMREYIPTNVQDRNAERDLSFNGNAAKSNSIP